MFDGVLARGRRRGGGRRRGVAAGDARGGGGPARARGLPPEVAEAIAGACEPRLRPARAGRARGGERQPRRPARRAALRERLGGAAAEEVHRGATSQDILDTAAMLVARDAREPLREDLAAAADAAARLAREHRATPITGRTLLQQAVPTTFGLKAAGWMAGLDAAGWRLATLRPAAQLGGPAGTLDGARPRRARALRPRARARGAAAAVAHRALPDRGARLARSGRPSGAIAKAAGDVVLLAQTRGRRGPRGRARRLLLDAAQAQPGRRGLGAGLRPSGARAGRHAARGDGAGARARGRRLARRVGAAALAADRHRLRGGLAARLPGGARGRRRAHARQPHRDRRTGGRGRAPLVDRALSARAQPS